MPRLPVCPVLCVLREETTAITTTTLLLIRHAAHDWLGHGVAGRTPGVGLNEQGRAQARELVARLRHVKLGALFVSPRERTQETAAPLLADRSMSAMEEPQIDEIDFGAWTGRTFEQLDAEPGWKMWVNRRSVAQPPGGETIVDAQRRVVSAISRMQSGYGGRTIALVSHGDVIKAALAHYLGLSLDNLERFEIAPASISVLASGGGWAQVKLVNSTGELS
jgi:broad specificity phosphatase PhoE